MSRPRKLNGWILAGMSRFHSEPSEPPEWEKLLKAEGIRDDRHALHILSRRSEKALRLKGWIEANSTRRFVPVEVLESVGLKVTIDFRFPAD